MSEKRPVNLHFFTNDHFNKFSRVSGEQDVSFTVSHNDEGWYVRTEELTPQDRRKLIAAWANVSMERITNEKES